MSMLQTKELFHDYRGLKVLFGVGLEVKEGERHAIIGPNGAGKTTLFNVITGLYKPRRGKVLFKGGDITGFKPCKLARLGMSRSFQISGLFLGLTVFQNVRLAILSKRGIRYNLLRKVDNMQSINEETHEFLSRINLDSERSVPANMLSYGKQRSLEISLALARDPELVLLDEPTAGMSPQETRAAVDLVRRMTQGKTMVIVEHDMDVVFSLADRITVLDYGSIVASGTPEEIRTNQDVQNIYLGKRRV